MCRWWWCRRRRHQHHCNHAFTNWNPKKKKEIILSHSITSNACVTIQNTFIALPNRNPDLFSVHSACLVSLAIAARHRFHFTGKTKIPYHQIEMKLLYVPRAACVECVRVAWVYGYAVWLFFLIGWKTYNLKILTTFFLNGAQIYFMVSYGLMELCVYVRSAR